MDPELGLAAELNNISLSRFERCIRLLSIKTLDKLAQALDLTPSELVKRIDDALPDEPPPKPKRHRKKPKVASPLRTATYPT